MLVACCWNLHQLCMCDSGQTQVCVAVTCIDLYNPVGLIANRVWLTRYFNASDYNYNIIIIIIIFTRGENSWWFKNYKKE